jgi:hypothetical protein
MAKMWQVDGVACHRELEWNARSILGTRVAEVVAHLPALTDPLDAVGHHDLRISIKRLRYSLEFFAVCYDPVEVSEILSALSTIQDDLGELHDADVFIPELQRTYDGLREDRDATILARVDEARARSQPASYEEFAATFVPAGASDPRPGILGVINRLRAQRRERYLAAVELWARLEADGFRDRLERLGEGAE